MIEGDANTHIQRREWLSGTIGTLVIGMVILQPGSGFKSAAILIGVAVLLGQAIRTRSRLNMGGIFPFILLYLATCVVSTFFSVDTKLSTRQLVKLVESLAVFFVIVNLLSRPNRLSRGLCQFGFAFGIIACADGIRMVTGALTGTLVLDHGRWFDSLLGYPTIAAGMYATGLIIVLTNAIRTKNLPLRIIWLFIIAVIVVLLYWLQTRSVLVGILGALFVFVLAAPLGRRCQLAVLAGATVMIIVFALIPGDFRERITSGSFSDRLGLWADAGFIANKGIDAQPFRHWTGFGYGHRIFESLHKRMAAHERKAPRIFDHAHNAVVESYIQTGIIGPLALAGLVLALVWRGFKNRPSRLDRERRLNVAGLAAAIVLLLIYAQFSLFFAYLPALMFWSLMGAYLAALEPRQPI